ncbi:unnamed protein product [Rhizophagus irregularis]|nr:unnamed protein product [Rhizophagus irregularis]
MDKEKIKMICEKCKFICNAIRFQQNFKNWTSDNNDIDKLIQDTQLSIHKSAYGSLEWIPYDRFYDIKYIAKGGFGKVYKANWIDGPILVWDDKIEDWKRKDQNKFVALKSLNNSTNITLEFINEIASHYKLSYTSDYAKNGSLRNYLDTNYNKLRWYDKIYCLQNIATGLVHIHNNEIIHRDLHIGNILSYKNLAYITDMGLCKPADYKENTKNEVFGVLPYIAPEVLRGQDYTKGSDIYSFGIIMYEMVSGLPPYHDLSHDKSLAIKICLGFRPRFNIKVPQLIVHLIKRCLDANPSNRPTAFEIFKILDQWKGESRDLFELNQTELQKQINEADEINKKLSTSNVPSTSLGLSYKPHSEAIYASRLLDFNDLPEPKNSDDYYEHHDNITSMEYSESQQINISQ